jgi:hypothetical protein
LCLWRSKNWTINIRHEILIGTYHNTGWNVYIAPAQALLLTVLSKSNSELEIPPNLHCAKYTQERDENREKRVVEIIGSFLSIFSR